MIFKPKNRLFVPFLVALVELIDTSCRIHKNILSCIERMRCIGDIQLYHRVLLSVFKHDSFLGVGSRTAQKHVSVTHVLENYGSVGLWVNVFFHDNQCFIRILPYD